MQYAGSPIAAWWRRGAIEWTIAHYQSGEDDEFHDHERTQVHFLLCGSFVEYWPDRTQSIMGPYVGVLPAGQLHRNKWGDAGALILTAHLAREETDACWRGWRMPADGVATAEMADTAQSPDAVREYLANVSALRAQGDVDGALMVKLLGNGCSGKLSAMARASGRSASGFTKFVKRQTGVSPNRLRLETMLARAAAMIVRTETPLSEVAQTCGFADQAHLTRMLRRRTAVTPGALRLAMRTLL